MRRLTTFAPVLDLKWLLLLNRPMNQSRVDLVGIGLDSDPPTDAIRLRYADAATPTGSDVPATRGPPRRGRHVHDRTATFRTHRPLQHGNVVRRGRARSSKPGRSRPRARSAPASRRQPHRHGGALWRLGVAHRAVDGTS